MAPVGDVVGVPVIRAGPGEIVVGVAKRVVGRRPAKLLSRRETVKACEEPSSGLHHGCHVAQALADLLEGDVREERLSQRDVELHSEVAVECIRGAKVRRGATVLEPGLGELPEPCPYEAGVYVDSEIVPGLQVVHQVDARPQGAATDVEHAIARLEALAGEEVELEATDLVPFSADETAMTPDLDVLIVESEPVLEVLCRSASAGALARV